MRVSRILGVIVMVVMLAGLVLAACAGPEGEPGLAGEQGPAGVGIQSIVNNGDGTFTLELTDETTYTTDDLTGPQGPQGIQGETGATGLQGTQGEPGPNWIKAMGAIWTDGTVRHESGNIESVSWNIHRWEIKFTDFDFVTTNYVALVTAWHGCVYCTYASLGGSTMIVYCYDTSGYLVEGAFSFVVLQAS